MSAGDWKEMYRAAEEGDLELVRYHISNGINPNYQHPEVLSTPLVASIIAGHVEVARFLLENGADSQLVSYFDDLTPVQAAKIYRRGEILSMIQGRVSPTNWLKKTFCYL